MSVCVCVFACVMVNVLAHCCGCEYLEACYYYCYFIMHCTGYNFCNICLQFLKFKSLATF